MDFLLTAVYLRWIDVVEARAAPVAFSPVKKKEIKKAKCNEYIPPNRSPRSSSQGSSFFFFLPDYLLQALAVSFAACGSSSSSPFLCVSSSSLSSSDIKPCSSNASASWMCCASARERRPFINPLPLACENEADDRERWAFGRLLPLMVWLLTVAELGNAWTA